MTRLNRLEKTGRCTAAEKSERVKELRTVRLSLAESGKPCRVELDRWITSREVVPAGTFWNDAQRLSIDNPYLPVAHAPEDQDKLTALQKMIFRGR
jgi:hypothetical protein